MTPRNRDAEARDEVLYAFHLAYERPTAAQITEWTRRYPQFADDLRAHAAVARDWEARTDAPAAEPDQTMLSRGHSRVLNALHNAAAAAAKQPAAAEPCQSFQQMMSARGTDVPRLVAPGAEGGPGRRLCRRVLLPRGLAAERIHPARQAAQPDRAGAGVAGLPGPESVRPRPSAAAAAGGAG